MKKIMTFIMIMAMMLSIFTIGVYAAAKPTENIKKGTPVVDGVIDEVWDHVDEMKLDRMTTVGEATSSGYAKMLWDDENIYGLVVITDTTKNNATEALHTEDCLEVFFDLENKKTETYTEKNQFRFLYDIISPLATRNPENISTNALDYIKLAGTEPSADKYVYEFSINYKVSDTVTFKENMEIGIDFGYDDNTKGDNVRTAALSWNAEGNVSANPSLAGTVKLVNEEAMPPIIIEEAVPETPAQVPEPATATAPTVTAPATADIGLVFIGLLILSAIVIKKVKI